MTALLSELHFLLPQMTVLFAAVLALLSDLFFSRKTQMPFYIACVGLILAVVLSISYSGYPQHLILNGSLLIDDVSALMNIFIAITVLLVLLYGRPYLVSMKMSAGDFYVLSLFATTGMMLLASSHTLLMLYLSIELLSLPLYALSAMQKTEGRSAEAALKYFVMGGIASGMLLYGISLLYGATGQLDFTAIYTAIHQDASPYRHLVAFSLVFILSGIAFKLAAIPFHMWAPDVYQGAPLPAVLLISSAPKIAVIALLIHVLSISFIDFSATWQSMLLILALLSAGLGNVLAIAQSNLRRLFAYSAISHMGYALLGVFVGTPAGFSAALYYVVIYALMAVAGFGLLAILSHQGQEFSEIDDLKGLNRRNPWLAFLMMVTLFSMAGVPPTVGFFTKLFILKALVDSQLLWVAAVALIFAVIGAYYYLRVIKVMYFDAPQVDARLRVSKGMNFVFSLNSLSLLYLGLFPGALISACLNALT
jgi:NADH-quinone oxidoreductase subunit N